MSRTPDDQLEALIGAGVGEEHLRGLPPEALVASIRQLAGELGDLLAGTSTGRQDTADDPTGVPVPMGQSVTIVWQGAAAGTTGRAGIAFRVS